MYKVSYTYQTIETFTEISFKILKSRMEALIVPFFKISLFNFIFMNIRNLFEISF